MNTGARYQRWRAHQIRTGFIIALLNNFVGAQQTTQLCFFGPDSKGHFVQHVVPVRVAETCEDCICAPLRETCLLGPDSAGNYATSEVDASFAESCPRQTCTCSSHNDYQQTAQYRLQQATTVYEIEIGNKFDHGIDPDKII